MLILAVDTSTRAASLALVSDDQVLTSVDDSEQVPYAARLFSDVALLQRKGKFSLRDVDLFAVATGPGSFTGLRVGLSAVKGWAEVYGKPIAGIGVLEAIAAQSRADAPFVAPCMDARRGAIFGAIYRRGASNRHPLAVTSPDAILSVREFYAAIRDRCGAESVVIATPTPEVLTAQSLCRESVREPQIETVSPILAPTIGILGFERAARGELLNALTLDANYIRRSDAEVQKAHHER